MILEVFDDRKRSHTFGAAPKRVVSLVPSDTLSLAEIGCAGAIVGRTDYCELPKDVVEKLPSVGGTKNARIEAICDLSPDLIIANQEENSRRDLEALAEKGFRVFVVFPKRVADGLALLAKYARIFRVDRDSKVQALVKRGYEEHKAAEASVAAQPGLRTFCPIWMDPLMTINGDTFISDMMRLTGAINIFADRDRRYPLAADLGKREGLPAQKIGDRDTRYPRVTLDEVMFRAPELILLPNEPHPFTDEDANVFRALQTPAKAKGAIVKMEGKDLCWYGARSVEAIPALRKLVNTFREC